MSTQTIAEAAEMMVMITFSPLKLSLSLFLDSEEVVGPRSVGGDAETIADLPTVAVTTKYKN